MTKLHPIASACLAGFLLTSPATLAVDFSWSGFLTLGLGKSLSGSVQGPNEIGFDCPCMIADFSQAGVYEDSWSLNPDSKLGLQGSVMFNDNLSLTGQIVSRGSRDFAVNLEWVYLSYQLNDNNTLQLGRKRLPLFYYSEQQDVGFTYPWVHLPGQTYGWEVVNYNGVNWAHSLQIGDWSGIINTFAGSETRKDGEYSKIYSGLNSESDTRWSGIVGAELVMSKNWFEGRLMLMQSDTQGRLVSEGEDWSAKAKQQIYGASALVDYQDYLLSAELFFSDRTESYGRDLAYTLSVGRRFDNLLVFLTHGMYQQKLYANNPAEVGEDDREKHRNSSVVLKYDVSASAAVKLQFDHWQDFSGSWFKQTYGDANTLSLSYDRVF
ncbi:hypothetical protein [Rheinheimera sp.]|uniref:hypothetical protein n=1 Tax=Rheinheimera sp. TaxID=1869214 RepID=UPI0025FBFD50|nr:hypothetical protein [Rheinheimera sp.]